MANVGIQLRRAILAAAIAAAAGRGTGAEPPPGTDALVVRLIHPERQAAQVLARFDGARAPHPAAALAAWKRTTRDPAQLGKPLEAAIAFFNPEMVPEWRVLHRAELHLDLGAADGAPRWYAAVPHDDGTLAAAITAKRLTDGADEAPAHHAETAVPVQRLGPPGSMLAARVGNGLLLASSREQLRRGLANTPSGTVGNIASAPGPAVPRGLREVEHLGAADRRDSGLMFELDPARLTGSGPHSMALRRAGELLRGLSCRRLQGSLALQDECLALEVTTSLEQDTRDRPAAERSSTGVEPAWLSWVPRARAMAVLSLAFDPSTTFWDSAFTVADRVDRADPARAELAPLRVRANLLAATAGVRPEVDLWPHLKGVTACILGDPEHPGHPAGALLVMHLDTDSAAARLSTEFVPRLAAVLTGTKSGAPAADPHSSPEVPRRLATVSGRGLTLWRRGRDVLVAWGDDVLPSARAAAADPDRSVAPLCAGWPRSGKPAPQRVGAIWPARCWSPPRLPSDLAPAWRSLTEGPPAVWWGWTDTVTATDSIRCAGLRELAHRFIDQIPLDPPPSR